jgi:hypothetical protein
VRNKIHAAKNWNWKSSQICSKAFRFDFSVEWEEKTPIVASQSHEEGNVNIIFSRVPAFVIYILCKTKSVFKTLFHFIKPLKFGKEEVKLTDFSLTDTYAILTCRYIPS